MFDTKMAPSSFELKDDAQGKIEAVFSTFGVVDSDGDVLTREAFTDGQRVPLVWAHDWSRPIGKGVVKTDPKRAIFSGQFFMDTTDGKNAYQTVKAMSDLQEFSWGFRILDAEQETRDGMPVRVITKAEVFEVSPVLVGANRETYTLALKSGLLDMIDLKRRRLSRHQLEAVIATLQALMGDDEETEAETPPADEAGKSGEQPAEETPAESGAIMTLAADGERLAAELGAFTARLKDAAPDERLDARHWAGDVAQRMTTARQALDAVLRRADEEASLDLSSLFKTLDIFDARYGAIPGGTTA